MTPLLLLTLLAAAPESGADLYSLPQEDFIAQARRDLTHLRRFSQGLQASSSQVQAHKHLFSTSKKSPVLPPEHKRTLLALWGPLFSYASATEALRQKYWDFIKLPPKDPRYAWGFLLTHTALTTLLSHGLAFSNLALGKPQLETLLDEPHDEFGIPQGAFSSFKLQTIHVSTSTQLLTGDAWAPTVLPSLKASGALEEQDVHWAWQEMKRQSKAARGLLRKRGLKLFAGNAKELAQQTSSRALFPVQRGLAEWLGDTRVARQGLPLISPEQVEQLVLPRLQPGDLIVTRQNWFLSNIGLPGFWPHAELYLGTAPQLAASFDQDPEVQAWARSQPEQAANLSELLARRYPEGWEQYTSGSDFQGHAPIRVMESISEGVSLTAVEHAFGVDYLAAMRPRLGRRDKAQAIARAFGYQGRPYDFNFDFFSDSTLVCTELVYKSYQPSQGMQGLRVELVDIAGRRTLPANELVRLFDAEYDSPQRQLDFVLFIDAHEGHRRAFERDVATFRTSWRRMKWDVAQP